LIKRLATDRAWFDPLNRPCHGGYKWSTLTFSKEGIRVGELVCRRLPTTAAERQRQELPWLRPGVFQSAPGVGYELVPLSAPDGRWDRLIYPIQQVETFLRAHAGGWW